MRSALRSLSSVMSCVVAFLALVGVSAAQQQYCPTQTSGPSVTTWHNDNNRTAWQCNEATLNPTSVSQTNNPNNFGLLWQWQVTGRVYAQPLAVANVSTKFSNCTPSCNLVLVATEYDMLYAFNASPSVNCAPPTCNPLVWSINLAAQVTVNNYKGSYVDCTQGNAQFFF